MPKFKVGVSHPHLPQGEPVEVPPVGVVPNGETVTAELSAEKAEEMGKTPGLTVTPVSTTKKKEGGDE